MSEKRDLAKGVPSGGVGSAGDDGAEPLSAASVGDTSGAETLISSETSHHC